MANEGMTRRERWRQADAERAAMHAEQRGESGRWGIRYLPDERDPVALAGAAFERGDRWFQIDLPVAYVQGYAYMSETLTRTAHNKGDPIGGIEAQGWHLEHVATAFVQRGHASTKRAQMIAKTSADDVAYHGELVALYVFRRAENSRRLRLPPALRASWPFRVLDRSDGTPVDKPGADVEALWQGIVDEVAAGQDDES